MLEDILISLRDLAGQGDGDLAAGEMALRALIIYLTAVLHGVQTVRIELSAG